MSWERVRQALEFHPVAMPPASLPEDEAFRRYASAVTVRNLKLISLLAVAASAVALGVDRLVYRGAPGIALTLAWMRAGQVGVSAIMYLALRRGAGPRRAFLAASAFSIVCAWAVGYTTGVLGDLGAPWFHFSYMIFVCLFVPVVPLHVRALYGLEASISLLAGFSRARPLLPPHPMLVPTVTFLVFVVTMSTLIGNILYQLIHQGFASRRARDAAVVATEEINLTLQDRVREQTHELRQLAAHLETTREDERARLARELHDELGQELTAMRYTLTFTRQRFEQNPASIRENLTELESLLGRTAATTRNLVSDLRPRILDDLGLDAAIAWLLAQTEQRTGLRCTLINEGGAQALDAQTSIAAFRIVQESLTNVARHAQASRVDVEVRVAGDQLEITIRDDGVGLPTSLHDGAAGTQAPRAPAAPSERRPLLGKGGMGLIGMRERADALGGAIEIAGGPGVGTTVRVRLPVLDRESTGSA